MHGSMDLQSHIPDNCSALIVDDNLFARRLLATMLKQVGFAYIHEADCGLKGVEMALREPYDLILLDWIMPDKDGADILQILKSCEHPFDRSPILVTSTVATRDSIVTAARLGAAGFIVQPFATVTLASRVFRIMQSHGKYADQENAGMAQATA
ncbi:MAG: response regulator [Rhodobiaceae bacterium]|nr:response regulator [Rhodobiaceae bacterium]MCC0048216.1 response regulator [Rhodobiaceae bacterium]